MTPEFQKIQQQGKDYIVAVVVATEVPPDSPDMEFRAVLDVMRNRSKLWGLSLVEVVLAPRQFSAVCREAYWRRASAGLWIPAHVERAFGFVQRDWSDTVAGATHYFSPISMEPKGSEPGWIKGMEEVFPPGVRLDYFRFFKGEGPRA